MRDLLSGEVRTYDGDLEIEDEVLQHGCPQASTGTYLCSALTTRFTNAGVSRPWWWSNVRFLTVVTYHGET